MDETKANAAAAKVKKEGTDEARSTTGDVDPDASKENLKLPNAVEWLPALISSKSFFGTCRSCSQEGTLTSTDSHKAIVNYLCLTCADPCGICQLCMHKHANHHILQIRRSSYHDVVREQELKKLINTEGIQTYIINSSQVVFLRERPQSRNKSNNKRSDPFERSNQNPGGCLTCGRHLHEGLSYCSLGCKVAYCTRGSPLGKQLPPGLELRNKPQGMSHWLSFQPHTPQLKPKLNQSSYGNKRKKQALHSQTPEKGDGGYKAHLHYYSSSPHQIFHRHRRKKFKPRQSPCA